jgi:RNA polymerase sigma-70 factor (ECF subfamily)
MGVSEPAFHALMLGTAEASHWGDGSGGPISDAQQAAFLESIHAKDLVLARACAMGNEAAWNIFLKEYRELLYRAASAITGESSAARELADSLYAELYGLATHGGERRSKFDSYTGRGSLAGWLRSVLARSYIDQYRKRKNIVAVDDHEMELLAAVTEIDSPRHATPDENLHAAVRGVFAALDAEDRFLLRSYYMDGRNLAEIAGLLRVHESTISRRIKRLTGKLNQQLLKRLQASGLSRRAAEEALQVDVRDLDVNVKRLLQVAEAAPFQRLEKR